MEEHIERNKRVLEQWERFHRQEPWTNPPSGP